MSKSVGNTMNCYPQSPPVLGSSGLSNQISPPCQTLGVHGSVWSRSSWELFGGKPTSNPRESYVANSSVHSAVRQAPITTPVEISMKILAALAVLVVALATACAAETGSPPA